MKWLDIAWEQNGQQEVSGRDANPEIVRFFADADRPDITSDEVAWCAAFVGACLERADISIASIPKESRLLARSYLKFGTPIDKARVGAIAIFSRGSRPHEGHVAFVVGETKDDIVILGGNQSNMVCTQHYAKRRLLGLRWPEPPKAAAEVDRQSRSAAAAHQVQKDSAKLPVPQVIPQPPAPDLAPPPALPAGTDLPSPDAIIGKAQSLQSSIETGVQFAGFVSQKWPWIMLAFSGYWLARIAWNAWQIRAWRVEAANTGGTTKRDAIEVPA